MSGYSDKNCKNTLLPTAGNTRLQAALQGDRHRANQPIYIR
ncbi:hypothetical protein PF66_00592 [Pseudomonas asplenii]|uniref:Uncharacterized protein n=1 Tax=Pseudomonas asplenii TaxID=53407 RepID=A0A0M9GJI9_9PSED|nr:hypothetical protein PF66_00592 [Pseudomonas fuscovaginae]KPA97412.1 hypothetical protein PF70_02567 [Pseudomonas fuscovaginae]